jgi:hypothetical protein
MTPINPHDVGRIPLGHEPPGGDFARYVESLSSGPRVQGPPMQQTGSADVRATRAALAAGVDKVRSNRAEAVRVLETTRRASNNLRAGAGQSAVTVLPFKAVGTGLMVFAGVLYLISVLANVPGLVTFAFITFFIGAVVRNFGKQTR